MTGMLELLLRSRKFIGGLAVVVTIIMFGIIGPMVTRNPQATDLPRNQPPSWEYPLGTTSFGEDVFAQLCTGIRNSLFVGLLGGGLGTLFAVLFGALGSYKGGWADEASNFVTNVIMVFPVLPLLLLSLIHI